MENVLRSEMQDMQSALLETLHKLADIQAVEGFDPKLLVACYKNETGEENLYLPAESSMLWFRLKYPHGRLEQVAVRITDTMATVEGRVFDENGGMLANAFVTRYRSDTDPFGKDYVQNAGTCAIRKALGNCGFGTPLTAEFLEGVTEIYDKNAAPEQPVDRGTIAKRPVPPVPNRRQNTEKSIQPQHMPAGAEKVRNLSDVPDVARAQTAENPLKAQQSKTVPVPPPVMGTAPSTLEEAMSFMVPTGRYAGKTFAQLVAEKENDAIRYFLRPIYAGKPIQKAAMIVAGQYGL